MLFAQAKGFDKTLKIWENRRIAPFFAVFVKNTCTIQYSGKNKDEAEERLKNFFDESEGTEYADQIFEFRMYADFKKQYLKTDQAFSTFYFTINERPAISPQGGNFPAQDYFLQTLSTEINALRSEISALKAEKVEEEEEEEEQLSGIGAFERILDHPLAQQVIGGLTQYFLKVKEEPKIITNLAGVPEQDERAAAYQYVEILLQKGVKPEHLRKLAEMPTAKIKSLLLML